MLSIKITGTLKINVTFAIFIHRCINYDSPFQPAYIKMPEAIWATFFNWLVAQVQTQVVKGSTATCGLAIMSNFIQIHKLC
jgi:hypothetical protein